jgi:hypothetical protein
VERQGETGCIIPLRDKYEEYRKRAHEAQMMADQSNNQDDKASWLRIAQRWMDMLPKAKKHCTLKTSRILFEL